MKYKTTSFIFLFIMIYSCNVSRRIKHKDNVDDRINLTGEYLCMPQNLYSSTITLNKDSTFKYEYKAGDLYTSISKGRWHLSFNEQYLILNSNFRSDSDFIYVDEEKADSLNKIRICVYDQNDHTFPFYLAINPTITDDHKEIDLDSGLIRVCSITNPPEGISYTLIKYLVDQSNNQFYSQYDIIGCPPQ